MTGDVQFCPHALTVRGKGLVCVSGNQCIKQAGIPQSRMTRCINPLTEPIVTCKDAERDKKLNREGEYVFYNCNSKGDCAREVQYGNGGLCGIALERGGSVQ